MEIYLKKKKSSEEGRVGLKMLFFLIDVINPSKL